MQQYTRAGGQEGRSQGVQVVQEFRNAGVQEFKDCR